MKIITKRIHDSQQQQKGFHCIKEYCVNLPKFCNLGKGVTSLGFVLYDLACYPVGWWCSLKKESHCRNPAALQTDTQQLYASASISHLPDLQIAVCQNPGSVIAKAWYVRLFEYNYFLKYLWPQDVFFYTKSCTSFEITQTDVFLKHKSRVLSVFSNMVGAEGKKKRIIMRKEALT